MNDMSDDEIEPVPPDGIFQMSTSGVTNWKKVTHQLEKLKSKGISVQLSAQEKIKQKNRQQQKERSQLNKQQQRQQQRQRQLSSDANINVSSADNGINNSTYDTNNTKRNMSSKIVATSDDVERNHDVLKNNQFALLSELDIRTTQNKLPDQLTMDQTTKSDVPDMNISTQADVDTPRARFCPPIILFNVDIKYLVSQFKLKFPNIEIKIINTSRSRCKLYIKDYQAYLGMMALLKEKKIESHSFTPAQNKQVSVILRGLHHLSVSDEVKSELDILLPGTVSHVQSFLTPFMKKNNVKSDLFLVTLSPGKAFTDIVSLKYLFYQKIKWEKPHSFAKEVQCKRCQRWGHIAKNCNHNYQCVKCDKTHEPGQCLQVKSDNSQAYCINCKTWGHPANFRGCEALKSFSARNASAIKANKASHTFSNNDRSAGKHSSVTSNISYANMLRKNVSSAQGTIADTLMKEFLLLAKQILNPEPLTLEQRIELFLKNFKLMSPDERKNECVKLLRELDVTNV